MEFMQGYARILGYCSYVGRLAEVEGWVLTGRKDVHDRSVPVECVDIDWVVSDLTVLRVGSTQRFSSAITSRRQCFGPLERVRGIGE
ncbi:unnamed protein product [Enterobius vermicularis]|uniref:Transposase n=1 Tax=Enterobius vermicularis TaxID=51028 RepID=A0A0N4UWD0_ENTVE|nr:unnamed protein product [Enterobius vermicularis]